jgi:DNA-directed RNA polymerase subunit beta
MPSRSTERINFGKIKEVIAPPNLIELQTNSYKEFLQADVAPSRRKNLGLQAVFTEVFPIESYDGKCVLDLTKSASRSSTGWNASARA